jgi:hypothetical protein
MLFMDHLEGHKMRMINLRTSIRILRVLTVLATIGLVACSTPVVNGSAKETSGTTSASNRWLLKEPCAAPCYEGITPGNTTGEEAQKLLQQNPAFSDVELHMPNGAPELSSITWNWSGTQIESEADFDGSLPEHIIYALGITLRDPIKLNDITSAYGYPTYVQAEAEGGDIPTQLAYGLHLYYISSGIDIDIYNHTSRLSKPIVSPETLVHAVGFFPPSMDGFHKAIGRIDKLLIPWQGTFNFDLYCNLQYKSDAVWHCR